MQWTVEPFHEFWQRMMTPPEPLPPEPPSAWDIEKSANRLQRQVDRAASGRWIPTLAYRLNGRAVREFREAKELLAEAGQVLKGG